MKYFLLPVLAACGVLASFPVTAGTDLQDLRE